MTEAQAIFFELVDKHPLERVALLERTCGDGVLRAEVEGLLRAFDDAGSFLESPLRTFESGDTWSSEVHATDTPLNCPALTPELPRADQLHFLDPSDQPDRLGVLDHYEVISLIGRGGMGIVLRAWDSKLNRIVALKILAPELAANVIARQRFLREAQAAAGISDDHVVTVYAIEQEARLPYIVMEYVSGQSLEERIRAGIAAKESVGDPLPVDLIVRIGEQIAAGLAAAHAQGFIHRDIKPANILLEAATGRVKITDFGLARAVDDVGLSRIGMVTGTPQYMSPEQVQDHAIDHRSDLFSLGCVLYAMATGASPFRGRNLLAIMRRVCEHTPRPIREINPAVPRWLAELIEGLLAKDPARRIQTADEAVKFFRQHHAEPVARKDKPFVRPLEVGANTPSAARLATSPPRRSAKRLRSVISAALLLSALPLGAAVIYVQTDQGTLEIESLDEDVQVLVERNGELVKIIDQKSGQQLKLRSGRYELRLGEHADGLELSASNITLRRGEREIVRVRAIENGGPSRRQDPVATRAALKAPLTVASLVPGAGPVKVFILGGDSNLAGRARVSLLEHQASQPETRPLFQHLLKEGKQNEWLVRDDVRIKYGVRKGKLTVGYGQVEDRFGPELEFGHVVGNHFDEPVLLIKMDWAGSGNLFCHHRPPSSGLPEDKSFERALQEMRVMYPHLTVDELKASCGENFREMIDEISSTLRNLEHLFPEYEGRGHELAGFVWFQGWNDHVNREFAKDYTRNLINLIRDVRTALNEPNLPFVIGELGVNGVEPDGGSIVAFRESQAAATQLPEFRGNVAFVPTAPFWDAEADAVFRKGWTEHRDEWQKLGSDFPFHYLGSAKTFCQIGRAFGEAAIEMCEPSPVSGTPATVASP